MILIGTFLTNVLCAISPNCFPKFDNPNIPSQQNIEKIGFRDALSVVDNRIEYPLVPTTSGFIKGYTMKTSEGREIHAFEGIPFAEPPIGNLRFRSPQKKSNWNGVLYAGNQGKHCIQIDLAKFLTITGSEDCLYLNVYTPEVPRNLNESSANSNPDYPVIVWFYGGAFFFGSKDTYGPSYLLNKDVIFVTVNYRLGPLGFLSTGDHEAPGNFGLKDQTFALKWIQENIRNFGGDPTRVTLLGQSAGAASVHYHMLSKLSKGLFSSGISLSGSAFCPWACPREILTSGKKLGTVLNCPTKNSREFIECMRGVSAFAITAAQSRLYEWMNFPAIMFGPTAEPEGPDAFITEEPREIYRRGEVPSKVPWIVGFVPDEGNVYNIIMMITPFAYYAFNRNFDKIVPMAMDFRERQGDKDTVRKIRQFYFGDKPVSPRTYKEYSNMFGDRFIMSGVYDSMVEHSKIAPTFGYYFDYKGNFSILQRTGMTREEAGVSHYDDIMYVTNSSEFHPSINAGTPERAISDFVVDLYTNFASHLEPLHTNEYGDEVKFWDPIDVSSQEEGLDNLIDDDIYKGRGVKWSQKKMGVPKILEINLQPKLINFPKEYLERIAFWKDLHLSAKIIR